jgi:excisionase family DNA binding protein
MVEKIAHQIFDAIDRLCDAEREQIEAKRDLAKLAITMLASGDLHAGAVPIEKTPAQNADGLMTLQETAKFLGVTDQTVRAWRKRGIIEGLQFGEEWRFDRAELIRAGRKTQASKKPLRMVS